MTKLKYVIASFLLVLISCASQQEITKKVSEDENNYLKSETARSFLTNKYVSANLWYDKNKWYYNTTNKMPLEYTLSLNDGDVSVFFTSTGIEVPINNMHDMLIKNANELGEEVEITNDSIRNVNNTKVNYLQYKIVLNSIPLVLSMYYWSGTKGTVELSAVTSQGLYESKKEVIEELLNGLWILK